MSEDTLTVDYFRKMLEGSHLPMETGPVPLHPDIIAQLRAEFGDQVDKWFVATTYISLEDE